MTRGKVNRKAKACRYCGVINETGVRRIKSGLCYECRKSMHEPIVFSVSNGAKVRLAVFLSLVSLVFLTLAGYSVYTKYLVLPYGGRGQSMLLEFKGSEVTVPALALLLLAVGMLSFVAVNHHRCSNEKVCKKIMKVSLCAGLFLYSLIIFFGNELRYKLF